MRFKQFEATARSMWSEIPDAYKEGVDGLVVRRDAEAHPEHPDLYTMGMCFTEPYPSDYGGPDTTRSILALYYGSFVNVAGGDPDFPWEDEIWETITHELRHHLEFMADEDALEGVDYAVEQCHKREQGEDFDPWYFQSGLQVAPGTYCVEDDVYLEQRWRSEAFERAARLEVDWEGTKWWIPKPEALGDLHFIQLDGIGGETGIVELVLVRERPFLERIRSMARGGRLNVRESRDRARASGPTP